MQDVDNADPDTDLAIFGTKVTITCHHGYQFPDKTTKKHVVCLDSGSWTQVLDNCEGKLLKYCTLDWERFLSLMMKIR